MTMTRSGHRRVGDDRNLDPATVASFSDEWSRFDQSALSQDELSHLFDCYFRIFPWRAIPADAVGFDMGCGSGRWAKLVAPRVGSLTCIDASAEALAVAREALASDDNVRFIHASVDDVALANGSQDFGYSLGVLHHLPDTESALRACVELLKPGAPFLLYLYYRFDNRPLWFRVLWRSSEMLRQVVCRLPPRAKNLVTDALALIVYLPLARSAGLCRWLGVETRNFPLQFYSDASFYTMRTDSRDRFGTPIERRFTRHEIRAMMERSGCCDIAFSDAAPFWCAVGIKAP